MEITVIPKAKIYEPVLKLYPPKLSNKFLPEWYKKQKISNHFEHFKYENGHSDTSKVLTAKNCPAIQDYVSTGFIIPAWTNIYFTTAKDSDGLDVQYYDASIRKAYNENIDKHIDYHSLEQTKYMPIGRVKGNKTLKLQLPYWFKVPKGYNAMYQDPFYHFRNDIRCLTGIVEIDKWGGIAFPFEILKKEFVIEAGTPLVQVFIYKRDNLDLKINARNGSEKEYDDIQLAVKKLHISKKTYRTDR